MLKVPVELIIKVLLNRIEEKQMEVIAESKIIDEMKIKLKEKDNEIYALTIQLNSNNNKDNIHFEFICSNCGVSIEGDPNAGILNNTYVCENCLNNGISNIYSDVNGNLDDFRICSACGVSLKDNKGRGVINGDYLCNTCFDIKAEMLEKIVKQDGTEQDETERSEMEREETERNEN